MRCVLLLDLFAGFAVGWFSGLICLCGFCGGFPIVGLRVLRLLFIVVWLVVFWVVCGLWFVAVMLLVALVCIGCVLASGGLV